MKCQIKDAVFRSCLGTVELVKVKKKFVYGVAGTVGVLDAV
jgi:hypothetical protein